MTFLKRYLFPGSILLTIFLHLPFLNLPPKSIHVWRQSHTLAVARNFYLEEMNIFKTRVDNRMDGDGITGSHFPSFEFLLAGIYKVTGEHFLIQRVYCLLLHLFGIVGIFLLAQYLFNSTLMGGLAAWSYSWSPLLFYYGISALPDNLALPFSIWGLLSCLIWIDLSAQKNDRKWLAMLFGFFFITISGLTKIQYLAAGFFILAYLIVNRKKYSTSDWILFVGFGASTSILTLAWYQYAIVQIKKSGLLDFGIGFKPETNPGEAAKILISNLVSIIPESILNFSGTVLFAYAVFFLIKTRKVTRPLALPFLIWTGVFMIYHLIELGQMRQHDYYMMPYLPIFSILMGFGAYKLLNSQFRKLAVALLILQPILACVRIIPARFLTKEPDSRKIFYDQNALNKLQQMVPDSALCIVGPDDSKCIYFYFLKKKGFGYSENLSKDELADYIKRGAKYIYTTQNELITNPEISPFLDKKIGQEGNFLVYALKNQEQRISR